MPLLDRDFIRAFLQVFAGALSLVLLITLGNVLLDNYRYIFGHGDSRIGAVLLYFVLTLPSNAVYMLPMCAAASVLWVLAQKTRANEILAYLSCGVSPMRLAMPLLVCAGVLSAACLFLSERVTAKALDTAKRVETVEIKGRPDKTITRHNDVILKGAGERYFRIAAYDERTRIMTRVTIVDLYADGSTPHWRLEADSGKMLGEGDKDAWLFENAHVWTYDESGNVLTHEASKELASEKLPAPLEKQLDRFLSKNQDPKRMAFSELWSYLTVLEEQGKSNPELSTELHRRLSVPLSTLLLIFVMCAHAIRPSQRGVIVSFGGGLAWMAAFTVVDLALRKTGTHGVLPPAIAAWSAQIIFGIGALVMLRRSRFD